MTETVRSKLAAKVRSAVGRAAGKSSVDDKEEYIDDIGFAANHKKEKANLAKTPAPAKKYPEDGLTDPSISRTAVPVVIDGHPAVIDSQVQLYCMWGT
jgi:hypothetical protein